MTIVCYLVVPRDLCFFSGATGTDLSFTCTIAFGAVKRGLLLVLQIVCGHSFHLRKALRLLTVNLIEMIWRLCIFHVSRVLQLSIGKGLPTYSSGSFSTATRVSFQVCSNSLRLSLTFAAELLHSCLQLPILNIVDLEVSVDHKMRSVFLSTSEDLSCLGILRPRELFSRIKQ